MRDPSPQPPDCNAALVLAGRDGVLGQRASAPPARAVGEVCFNTAMTGYQEILTDPSYAGADHHLHLSRISAMSGPTARMSRPRRRPRAGW